MLVTTFVFSFRKYLLRKIPAIYSTFPGMIQQFAMEFPLLCPQGAGGNGKQEMSVVTPAVAFQLFSFSWIKEALLRFPNIVVSFGTPCSYSTSSLLHLYSTCLNRILQRGSFAEKRKRCCSCRAGVTCGITSQDFLWRAAGWSPAAHFLVLSSGNNLCSNISSVSPTGWRRLWGVHTQTHLAASISCTAEPKGL